MEKSLVFTEPEIALTAAGLVQSLTEKTFKYGRDMSQTTRNPDEEEGEQQKNVILLF